VGKGEVTRQAILERAAQIASVEGLRGLTIGKLAEELGLSKSGLFAHVGSKEGLEVLVVELAGERFVETVVKPALAAARGEPRLRAIFERWLRWPELSQLPGGCFFVAAAAELDDRPGPARERLVGLQRDWLDLIANTARGAIREGHFRKDLDAEGLAQDLYGIMLGCHHALRLLDDKKAVARARTAFDRLVGWARRLETNTGKGARSSASA
jgi:AcrR family transcriptional regulator